MPRLLLIDDDEFTTRCVLDALRGTDYAVEVTDIAESALAEVRCNCPHIALVSLQLRRTKAALVCERLRGLVGSDAMPIMVLAKHLDEEHVAQFLELGVQDFLQQPVQKGELLLRLYTQLQRVKEVRALEANRQQLVREVGQERGLRAAAQLTADTRQQHLSAVLETLQMGTWELREDGTVFIDEQSRELLDSATNKFESWHQFTDLFRPLDDVRMPPYLSTNVVDLRVQSIHDVGPQGQVFMFKGGARASGRGYGTIRCITELYRHERRLQEAERFEQLGYLASSMAHDFNNHLAVVSGTIERLQMRKDFDPSLQRPFQVIDQAVEQSAGIVRNLLTLARGGSVNERPVNVATLIQRTASLATGLSERIHVTVPPIAAEYWVSGDEAMLGNMLWNLCVNAADAMPNGGELTIGAEVDCHNDGMCVLHGRPIIPDQVCFHIVDTGTGISDEIKDRIFEPMVTGRQGTGGTGLGLASVAHTVRQNNGQIHVTSQLGKGTRFSIYLPRIDGPEATVKNERPAIHSYSLLIIDDQSMITDMLQSGLSHLGWEVQTANDPRQALQLWQNRESSFDCALVDLVMPEMTGVEVFDQLRQHDPDARVVLMSGTASEQAQRSLLAEGLLGVVNKPVQLRELNARLRELLGDD